MITIALPVWNSEKIIRDALKSCHLQCYEDKEILVIDDCSTDNTAQIAEDLGARVIVNPKNLGYAKNMAECVKHAQGDFIIFLCGDDKFTHPKVVSDMMEIFNACPKVAVVDRDYYQYLDGHEGAVVLSRESDILISSVNPSGMGFRKCAMTEFSDKIYIECPYMVNDILSQGWQQKKMTYDTVAVRLHPENQARRKSYYKGSTSENWWNMGVEEILWRFKDNYISLKNRVGQKALIEEIKINLRLEPKILLSASFWFFALFSLLTPSFILRRLSDFYRNRIGRSKCKIKKRWLGPIFLNLGAGRRTTIMTINVDVTDYPLIDQVVDLSKFPWPWKDESVDSIASSHLIEHIEDQKTFLNECHRILKKGGCLGLTVPHSSSVTSIGCLGHFRTYSYHTFNDYLCKDFYMFGKAKFRTISQDIRWWYSQNDDNVPKWMETFLNIADKLITPLIKLNVRVFENLWCHWVGGAREFTWLGQKL